MEKTSSSSTKRKLTDHQVDGLMWLQKRTNDRTKRGVEGTHQQ